MRNVRVGERSFEATKIKGAPVTGAVKGAIGGAANLGCASGCALFMPFIGLPLLVLSIPIAILSPLVGMLTTKAFRCPHCQTELATSKRMLSCPGCGHRLIRRGRMTIDVT